MENEVAEVRGQRAERRDGMSQCISVGGSKIRSAGKRMSEVALMSSFKGWIVKGGGAVRREVKERLEGC